MEDRKSKIREWFRKLYYIIFFILTLAVVFLVYPKKGTFKYEFQKGMPWMHSNLIAPYDFPVLKPDELIKAEEDSLLKNFIPYFIADTAVVNNQLDLLKTNLSKLFALEFDTLAQSKIDSNIVAISKIYKEIYQKGLLQNDLNTYTVLENSELVYVVKNNIAEQVSKSELFSLKSAYLKINTELHSKYDDNVIVSKILPKINLNDYLVANLQYDENYNEQKKEQILSEMSSTRGVVPAGVRIISQGDIVDNENYIILESLRKTYERKQRYSGWSSPVIIGQMLLIFILFTAMFLYLQNFNRLIFWKKRNFSMILSVLLVILILARLIYQNDQLNMYLLPIIVLPVIIRTFLGARMALYIHIVATLFIGFIVPNGYEYVLMQVVAGTVAVISLSKLHRRGHLVLTAFFVFVSYVLVFLSFELVKENSIYAIHWEQIKWFFGSSVLLLIAYPVIYIIEKVFGFISDVTLMELSDTNNPLLRKLAETAPGTFQHSMQVANMAEEAIRKIGGNPMLVRAGALYHDIGKMQSSQFFIENQSDTRNPHEKLSYKESVGKIISHVTDGVSLAHKHKLPESIIDFIKMHHGKGLVKYFHLKYKEENPDKDINEADFMYPGPSPNSRETTVVMLADSVEAAARSLPEKNAESLKAIVNQIIDSKVQNKELENAPVTFKDIKDIKSVFLEKLRNIYHLRIQYPEEKK